MSIDARKALALIEQIERNRREATAIEKRHREMGDETTAAFNRLKASGIGQEQVEALIARRAALAGDDAKRARAANAFFEFMGIV